VERQKSDQSYAVEQTHRCQFHVQSSKLAFHDIKSKSRARGIEGADGVSAAKKSNTNQKPLSKNWLPGTRATYSCTPNLD
jgi:hypothetical protein